MMTFEELINKEGAATVYSGTNVDAATQGALLEWCFDRALSDEDTTKWLRYYRRNLNMYYPIYLDRLRVESVRSNMDPFITEFVERLREDTGSSTSSGTSSKNTQNSLTERDETTTDNTNVRTPDLTTTGTNSDTQSVQGTSGNTSRTLGDVTNTGSEDATDNSTQRSMQIQYPEANMASIPQDVDNFPTSIDYAEGESDVFAKKVHNGSNTNTQSTDSTVTDNGTQSSTTTGSGSNSVTETGTDTNKFDGSVIKTHSNTGTGTESNTDSHSQEDTRKAEETEQGRHESPADILPRAIQAITSTNSIKWLVDTMQICFDNYYTI